MSVELVATDSEAVWTNSRLGDHCLLITKGTTPTSIGRSFTSSGIPFYKAESVSSSGRILPDKTAFIDHETHSLLKRSQLSAGDTLVSIAGVLGRVGRVSASDVPANTNQALAIIRLKPDSKVDPSFLFYILRSPEIARQIRDINVQAAQANISLQNVSDFKIPHPASIVEQRAIAEALGEVDELIGSLERLIAKKRDIKQAVMQKLLTGKTRLPGFKGNWALQELKTIVDTPVTDGPHLTPRFLEDGIPFLSVNNLVGNKIDVSDLRYISRADHEVFSRKCRPQLNDILLGKAASVGKVALVETDFEFNIWSPIAMIRVNKANSPRFVFYQLQSWDLAKQIMLLTNSSSQGNIGMGDIEKLRLHLPPLPEQVAIAEVLRDIDYELEELERRLAKTRDIKQGMMQQLLTGKVRLV